MTAATPDLKFVVSFTRYYGYSDGEGTDVSDWFDSVEEAEQHIVDRQMAMIQKEITADPLCYDGRYWSYSPKTNAVILDNNTIAQDRARLIKSMQTTYACDNDVYFAFAIHAITKAVKPQ